ncbi:hypothetical protein D3C87_324540 [compost metagenome]
MPEHLVHLAHSLSHCTEQKRKAEKAGNISESKYWNQLHRILTRACVEIGAENYKRII